MDKTVSLFSELGFTIVSFTIMLLFYGVFHCASAWWVSSGTFITQSDAALFQLLLGDELSSGYSLIPKRQQNLVKHVLLLHVPPRAMSLS